jgi:PAS domain S-box-containing protein
LFNAAPFAIIMFDKATGDLIDANKVFLDYLGYEKKDILGVSFFSLLSPDSLKKTQENYIEFQENIEGDNIFLNYYRTKGGDYKPLYWIKAVQTDNIIGNYSFGFALIRVQLYK